MEMTDILTKLPHRYPFLMVDRIIEKDGNYYGVKNVTINEPYFQGHFPGQPIMPGVMILEAMAQVAGLVTLKKQNISEVGQAVLLIAIDKVKFKKSVYPGDQLLILPQTIWCREQTASVQVRAMVEEQVAAEAQFIIQNTCNGG